MLTRQKFKPEIREQIADAWTRGSVTVVAKPRRTGQPTVPENNSPQPPAAPATSAQPVVAASPATPQPSVQASKPNNKFLLLIIAFLAIALTSLAVIHIRPTHEPMNVAQVADRPVNVQPVQDVPIATPSPPVAAPAVEVKSQPPEPPPVVEQPVVIAPAPPPVDSAALAREAEEKQRREEQERIAQARQKMIDQFYATLSDKTAELSNITTTAVSRLDDNTNKIAKTSWLRRSSLRHENEKNRVAILKALQTQQQSLNLVQDSIKLFAADPKADPNGVDGNIKVYSEMIAQVSQDVNATLAAMDHSITNGFDLPIQIQIK